MLPCGGDYECSIATLFEVMLSYLPEEIDSVNKSEEGNWNDSGMSASLNKKGNISF